MARAATPTSPQAFRKRWSICWSSRRSRRPLAHGVRRIVLSGGVAANSRLRASMKEKADAEGLQVFFPAPKFCTDNGAMIALAGNHGSSADGGTIFSLNADADLTL